MAGTREGGLSTARTIAERHGSDFYKNIGVLGGSTPTSKPKGFAANKEMAREAGSIGGKKSKRGKKIVR